MRFFFEIAYKGTTYHGWQKQQNALSVQQVIEEALFTLFQKEILTTGSGRTDTGVHCAQQFFHADIEKEFDRENLKHRLNALLPVDISILSIRKVNETAHARFDAVQRKYEYKICPFKNPFLAELSYSFSQPLDIAKMNEAASKLLLYKDFQSFSKVKSDTNTFICKIERAEWINHNELIIFYVSANRFLRGMVRALTGTLLDVGLGKASVEEFEAIIKSKDRRNAGRSAPAKGLFLTNVTYPEDIFIH